MKHALSKILLSLLLITSQINAMDAKPRPNVEYASIDSENSLLRAAEIVRDSILKRGISTVPRSDYDDAQTIFLWILEHNHASSVYVPKVTITKLLNRLEQLGRVYCPEEDFEADDISITNANEVDHLECFFHREINFSTGLSNFSNKLLTLVQNRMVIAGGGVVAVAAAAWYWFYYLHKPETQETESTEATEQQEPTENVV